MMSTATESGFNSFPEADMGKKQQSKRARAALTAVLGGVLAVALLVAVRSLPSVQNQHPSIPERICNPGLHTAATPAQLTSASRF